MTTPHLADYETKTDIDHHWLRASLPPIGTARIFISSSRTTLSTRLSAAEVKNLALWLIDAYEELTGREFPGLDRL